MPYSCLMHIHTLQLTKTTRVICEGCNIDLRLATYPEAVFVQNNNAYADNGPMLIRNGAVAVPYDFKVPNDNQA